MNNGEILTGKIDANTFSYLPYCINFDDLHYSSYNLEAKAREKLSKINGRCDDDIKIKNIVKITYNGKTIFENN